MISITKKPKIVNICGHELKIRYRKNLKNFGEFYGDDNEIYICNDDRWREHLLHELIHAVFYYSGHTETMEPEKEEALVRAIENGFKSLTFF